MANEEERKTYIELALPLAEGAGARLRVPTLFILAQWAVESAWGTSPLAVNHKNLAGISYTKYADYRASNKPADEGSGPYGGFRTYGAFVTEYVRVLSLSYYRAVLAAGKTNNIEATIAALVASPYAAGHYSGGDSLRVTAQQISTMLAEPTVDWQAKCLSYEAKIAQIQEIVKE